MIKKGNWIAKLMSKYDKSKITIYNLRQENKQLKEVYEENNKNYFRTLQMLEETNQILVSKIDKAIEYIEEFYERNQEIIDEFSFEYSYKHIIEILKGDSYE